MAASSAEDTAQLLPYERVRNSSAEVIKRAKSVRLKLNAILKFASSLDPVKVIELYTWDNGAHLIGSIEQSIDYVFSVDALNFGSGFSPQWKAKRTKSTYMTVANAIKNEMLKGLSFDAKFAKDVSLKYMAQILQIEPEFPLVSMFVRALNEIGAWVHKKFGSYSNLLESLPEQRRAAALIQELVSNLNCFNDVCDYQGFRVYFYKRAQILVNDLSLALNAKDLGYFPDLADLTMFADNLLAHVFWIEGILEYDADLILRIKQGKLLESGSNEEIEIRAASVQALDLLNTEIKRINPGAKIFPAMLDNYLWNKGQAQVYKQYPRHLTQTYFY